MLILLPPSEGKSSPQRGAAVDPAALSHPGLAAARRRVLDALQSVSARPDATDLLKVNASLADQVHANLSLHQAPAAPAAQVYSGVLYEAAGLVDLHGTARRRANASVRIFSALWGVLTPADRIPGYRLSMQASLPDIPPLGTYWAAHLGEVFDPGGTDVVLDCRSGAYAPAWTPAPGREWLSVRVVAERNGRRTVVSHHAKHTRGVLTGHLLRRPVPLPRTGTQVLSAAQELVGTIAQDVTMTPRTGRGPGTLEILLAH